MSAHSYRLVAFVDTDAEVDEARLETAAEAALSALAPEALDGARVMGLLVTVEEVAP